LHCPPVVERRPLSVRFDADHPRASLSGPRGGDRLFPSARLRSRIPSLTVSVARSLAGPVSGSEDRPRSDRPAILRTMPDGLTEPPKKGAPIVVVRGRRYHRTIPLRTRVCRYGKYESSKIRRGSKRLSRGSVGTERSRPARRPTGGTAGPRAPAEFPNKRARQNPQRAEPTPNGRHGFPSAAAGTTAGIANAAEYPK